LEERLWQVTKCLLLLCPDHATAWSDRKRIIFRMQGRKNKGSMATENVEKSNVSDMDELDLWQREIQFLNLLFTQHSKAPNSWAHRKWISKQMITIISHCDSNDVKKNEIISKWTNDELEICTSIAQKYPKNYYAWTHRRFVIDTLLKLQATILQNSNDDKSDIEWYTEFLWQTLESEYEFIHSKWMMKHVSDHSAVHYGGEVLRIMIFLKWNEQNHKQVMDYPWTYDDVQSRTNNFCHYFYFRYYGFTTNQQHGRQQQPKYNCTDTVDIKTEGEEWIIYTFRQSFVRSRELIQKFPSNEVIWIWRRICLQIYLDYFLGVKQHVLKTTTIITNFEENSTKAINCDAEKEEERMVQTVDQFIQKEIQTFVGGVNGIVDDITLKDEYDQRRYKLYSITYILWLVEHVRQRSRREVRDTSISKTPNQRSDNTNNKSTQDKWRGLRSRLIRTLVEEQDIDSNGRLDFSNMWMSKKKAELETI